MMDNGNMKNNDMVTLTATQYDTVQRAIICAILELKFARNAAARRGDLDVDIPFIDKRLTLLGTAADELKRATISQ